MLLLNCVPANYLSPPPPPVIPCAMELTVNPGLQRFGQEKGESSRKKKKNHENIKIKKYACDVDIFLLFNNWRNRKTTWNLTNNRGKKSISTRESLQSIWVLLSLIGRDIGDDLLVAAASDSKTGCFSHH